MAARNSRRKLSGDMDKLFMRMGKVGGLIDKLDGWILLEKGDMTSVEVMAALTIMHGYYMSLYTEEGKSIDELFKYLLTVKKIR